MSLEGKKVFITGATGGMGRPLVRLLQCAGAEVLAYSREKHGDLAGDIDRVCASLSGSPPDILINMAGFNEFAYCEDQDAESMIRVNLLAPIRLTQAVLPAMKARNAGHIVNIGSMTALIPLPHLTAYVASKAGLKGFSDSLRRELGGTEIAVTHITPRAVRTGANRGIKAVLNERTGVRHDDPEVVAERILAAILRREKDVRIGWPERFFAFVNAVVPAVIDRGLIRNRMIAEDILATHKPVETQKRTITMKRALPVFAALILSTAPAMAQDSAAAVAVPQHSSAAVSVADPMSEQIAYLQNEWARIKYQIPGDDEKITEIHKLEDHAAKVSAAYQDRAEPKIWEAIILSTEAGIVKGVSALPKVNRAKELLEQAEKIDTKALDGSAHTSLGSLYYQVPGWPIGFGDDALAEEHLKQALQINPEGIDPNFFYGDFLLQDGRYDEAKTYLNRALAAADRPGRALADAGRRQEAKAALAKIDEKLKTEGRNFN